MAMRRSSRPSFFKVLIKDYSTRLRLPAGFVQKYGKLVPENVKLRTISSGKSSWNVKVDEDWCLVGGWRNFVKDLELKLGEFVVFWFNVGDSISFDVWVYGSNCCQRHISSPIPSQGSGIRRRRRSCIPNPPNRPRFQLLLNQTPNSTWCLPQNFAKAAGLIGKKAVVLEYPPKRGCWPVILDHRLRPNNTIYIAEGWNDFRKENGLVLGRTYSFQFEPTRNVIQVKELKHD